MSQPLLIDQHIGSATYIETMRDEFILQFTVNANTRLHDELFLIPPSESYTRLNFSIFDFNLISNTNFEIS